MRVKPSEEEFQFQKTHGMVARGLVDSGLKMAQTLILPTSCHAGSHASSWSELR